ncbi:MAG: FAD-dependent oxidoreductase [Gammaproteobacteria bacterium]|nr:FAD-binding oxidoreductase [Gammaproteobacteria bacterium]NIR23709.1 FAD-binding oxidoreductase [Gammaproteobacteria bacterium]NIS05123.1 FAD-binding oxidoreductase [Gammaproteobacteria bacterium]NIU40759.1 FAD-dependent oxidoreductase [Gammaproteobacteria bacterium]NIV47648.1 FAD-dependent oxidoreductase [Gammaproteobacteria bacterium]
MTEQQGYDVVVIGAGVVGCAVAHALVARRMRVAIVEAGRIGHGTSGNTFAWINATSKTSDEAYHRLNALGAELYRELAREWGDRRIGMHRTGMLEWSSPDDVARLASMRAAAEQLERWGYPVAWVGRDALAAMEPHVRFEDGAEGLHAVADAWLDVATFLAFLAERLRADGARVLEGCRARELVMDDEGRVLGLETDEGRLHTQHVVVATGADTADVLTALTGYDAFAARFPLRRAAGLLVTTPEEPSHRLTRRILYTSHASHLHIRETAAGGLLIGADDTDGRISDDDSEDAVKRAAFDLLERVRSIIPNFAGGALLDGCRLGIGVRPMPADGMSIAGPVPSADGLHLAVTHSGVTLAPALATLIADTIESGELSPRLAPFGLGRFQTIA